MLGPRPRVLHGRIEQVARLLVGAQQRLDAAAELGVAGAGDLEVGGALGRRGLLQRRDEDRFFTHDRTSLGRSTSNRPIVYDSIEIVPSTSLSRLEAKFPVIDGEVDRCRGDREDSAAGTNAQWMRCAVGAQAAAGAVGPIGAAAEAGGRGATRSRRHSPPEQCLV